MALKDKSLFLYGFEINNTNQNLPFKASSGGAALNAVIPASFYTLATLATAIAAALNATDTANVYTVTVDRTAGSNLQNRITIATNGAFLSLLFSTGTLAASSIRDVINFGHSDLTGSTSYQNSTTSGTAFKTGWYGKNYQIPSANLRSIGSVNVATDGTKENIWWSIQQFLSVEFQYEAQADVLVTWAPFLEWMSKGRPFDFTPEVGTPATFYSVTLDKSNTDPKGMGITMKEMLPDFPLLYTTGPMEMRLLPGTY